MTWNIYNKIRQKAKTDSIWWNALGKLQEQDHEKELDFNVGHSRESAWREGRGKMKEEGKRGI